MSAIVSLIISVVLLGLVGGLVIWIVGMLGLGLQVDGYGSAFTAAIVIAIVGAIVQWLVSLIGAVPGGWWGAIINLVVAAIVLMISGSFLRGLRVAGFLGGIVGAIAIGLVSALLSWVVGLFM